jgi:hypothetical protein
MNKFKINILLLFLLLIYSCSFSENKDSALIKNGSGEVFEQTNKELKSKFDEIKVLYNS